MTDAVQTALIVSIPPTLLALATLISSLKNSSKLTEVHQATNGISEKLNAASRALGRSEGRAEVQNGTTPNEINLS